MGADAFFLTVADRVQVHDAFHVAPAALDLQELLVAQGDVLGGAQQVLAVEVLLSLGAGGTAARYGFDVDIELTAGRLFTGTRTPVPAPL